MLNNVIDDFPSPHFGEENSQRYRLSSSEHESDVIAGTQRNKPDTLARSIKKQLMSNPDYYERIKNEVRDRSGQAVDKDSESPDMKFDRD